MEKFIRFKLIDIIFKNIEVNYDKEDISSHIVKLLKLPSSVSSFTGRFIYWVVTFGITLLIILGYILYLNLGVGMISIFIFSLFFILYYYILQKTKKSSSDREHGEMELMVNFDDVLSNSLSVVTTKKVDVEKEYLTNKHHIYDAVYEKQVWETSSCSFAISLVVTFILVLHIYIILRFYKNKKIDSKITTKLIIIILFFVKYVKTASQRSISVITEYGKIAENEADISKIIVDPSNDGNKQDIPITGDIEFKNVSFQYKNDTNKVGGKTLDNVSFKIKPLSRVAIIGTNGSGKSTIIKLMCGFYEPSKGQILFNGVDVSQIKREYLRSKISVVSQKVVLFNRSVMENICYACTIPTERVHAILNKLDVMNVFKRLPQGLDTLAGSRGENLSGGQKQIIYLLRSYLSNKPITIMDEPTAAVDTFHKKYVIQMINEMAKKTTLIVVTHDSEYASSFSTKIYIEGGKIIKTVGENDSMMPYDISPKFY
jgi:ABC-type bacteriocin/lantibiotic exporter with double-glycine peptidase domain